MSQDQVVYLNREPALMRGGLVTALEELPAKLQKAPPVQWIATIKSLLGKGAAKQAEVDDCEVVPWLEGEALSGTRSVEREELIDRVKARQVTIKEVTLGQPRFASYSHQRQIPGSRYAEVLFIANSERANLSDRLEQIDWELEQFNFDIQRLSSEPQAVLRLEDERKKLLVDIPKAWDFTNHHFTHEAGQHGKNLVAHGRELVFGDTYLIEEIQSDWGQKGRRTDWQGIPRGPFVTDTKLWAGLVARRMLQRASLLPQVKKVAWIRGSMRNGGVQVTEDKLDDFYLKVVRGIVDKAIAKAGGKSALQNMQLGPHTVADVPMFEMTDAVRAHLQQAQPLYSLTKLRRTPHELDDLQRLAFFERARHMLGSVQHVRLVDHVWDLATGREVPGRMANKLVQVSLRADDPELVLDHECFHFAMGHLFLEHERQVVLREFAPGSTLNHRVYEKLAAMGELAAAAQCDRSAEEAAAHAFSLWARGRLDVSESPAKGIFADLKVLMRDAVAWIRRTVLEQQCTTSEEVFSALLYGQRAQTEERRRWREPA